MMRKLALTLITAGFAAVACTSGAGSSTSEHPHPATTSPRQFSAAVDNPWFPLPPGRTLVYHGTKDGAKTTEYFTVAHETQKIDGVPCRVVLDRVYAHGKLAEATRDYYTQDGAGNVWYFGEDTAELDPHGNMISTDGTWHTGRDGARPGIFMTAHPKVGDGGRQEYYPGQAEDHYEVIDLHAKASVPYKTFSGALRTKEWTPLEPGVQDNKYYAKGIGTVKEITVKGGQETNVLVEVRM